MNAAQTDQTSEPPATPEEERAARHLRMLARTAEIHMEVMETTRTEAVEAPQPGIDYGQRVSVIARSLRLTLLLEQKFAGQRAERRKAAAKREAAQEDWHALRVKMAVLAASYESSKDADEVDRRSTEVCERVEQPQPEVSEFIESCPAPVAVAALCRRWGFPVEVERWLEMADEALEHLGFIPSKDGEDDPPADPPKPRSAAPGRRKPKPPDTG